MAEVLGIVAGATQLLDLSARVLVASSRLYSKLKNVPGEIETLKKNTQQFIDLLWMISSDFDISLGPQGNPLHVAHRVTSILHDAMDESEELALLLERLSVNSSSSVKRVWSAVVSAKQERDIAERCQRIESLKTSLQLWYQHQSSVRMRKVEQQLSQLTAFQDATQDSLSLLAQQSSTLVSANQAFVTQFRSIDHPDPHLPQLMWKRPHQRREKNSRCNCYPLETDVSVSIYSFQLFLLQQALHHENCPQGGHSIRLSCGIRALNPKLQVMFGFQLGRWAMSMTGSISSHNVVDPERSPAFIAIEEAHDAVHDCLFYRRRSMYKGALGGLRPIKLDYMSRSKPKSEEELESILETLLRKLIQAYEEGRASPTDQTPCGTSLLEEFCWLAFRLGGFQERFHSVLTRIVEALVTQSSEYDWSTKSFLPALFNALQLILFHRPQYQRVMGLTLRRAGDGVWSYQTLQALKLDGILVAQGYGTADLVHKADMTPEAIALLVKNPILLEDYGQQPIHVAVLGRSENELRRLVSLDKVDFEAKSPPILSLAVGWTTGLEILLDAGADPEDAILVAIYRQHLPSIEILLDHGCPIFKVDSKVYSEVLTSTDLLTYATGYSDSSWDVVCLLIRKLVERRHELFRLAQKHLSDACLQTFGYCKKAQPLSVIDYHAPGIFKELVACGVKVPMALWPGRYATIYHHKRMTDGLAKKFFDNGFHDIDKPDDKGRTPLLIATRNERSRLEGSGQVRLMQWYLKKGLALPQSLSYAKVLNRLFRFTQMVSADIWIAEDVRLCGPLDVFPQLHPEGTQQRDKCRCWCSTSGCTPPGIVLRKRNEWWMGPYFEEWVFQQRRRRRWLFLLARYTSLGLSLDHESFTDICRLEIFDRLGMAHTCCDRLGGKHDCHDLTDQDGIDHSNEAGADDTGCNCLSLSSDELLELQEEDKDLKLVLESYVKLYLDLLQTHQADFEVFWLSWWLTLEYYLPFESTNQPEVDALSLVKKLHIPMPIQFVGVCDPETYNQERDPDVDSYGPQTEAIVSTVNRCVAALDADGVESILHQLVPDSHEHEYNRIWLSLDMTDNEDGVLVSEY